MSRTRITGCDRRDITLREIASLGSRRLPVVIYLRSYEPTPAVVRRPPRERLVHLARRAEKWLGHIRQSFPASEFVVSSINQIPSRLSATLTGRQLERLARLDGIHSIQVPSIGRARAKRKGTPPLSWFTVRARVAVQVEGQRHGLQTVEDRFILLRASSCEDAETRLRDTWKDDAKPYLNQAGHLVRWQLEEIAGCYQLLENDIDPKGTEVYSELRSRRINPSRVWIRISRAELDDLNMVS